MLPVHPATSTLDSVGRQSYLRFVQAERFLLLVEMTNESALAVLRLVRVRVPQVFDQGISVLSDGSMLRRHDLAKKQEASVLPAQAGIHPLTPWMRGTSA